MDFPKTVIPFAGQYDAKFEQNKHRLTFPCELNSLLTKRNPRVQFRTVLYARLGQVPGPVPDKCFYVLLNDVASYVYRPTEEDCALWTPLAINGDRRVILPGQMVTEAKLEDKIIICATNDGRGIEVWNPFMFRSYRPVPAKLA